GAAPRARRREHAGDPGGNGIPHERAAGKAARRRSAAEHDRPGDRRRHPALSRRHAGYPPRRCSGQALMDRRRLVVAAVVVFALVAAWVLFIGLPRWYSKRQAAPATAASTTPAPTSGAPVRKITATLYYVAEDGMSLVPAQREVPFAASVPEQARAIIEAQIA